MIRATSAAQSGIPTMAHDSHGCPSVRSGQRVRTHSPVSETSSTGSTADGRSVCGSTGGAAGFGSGGSVCGDARAWSWRSCPSLRKSIRQAAQARIGTVGAFGKRLSASGS
ncbi:MAG: hypothetical protein HYU66_08965 [Armatimonadetes bacterium]|nr:hypothetical protein [Armatimonadota bacterium]